MHLGLPGNIDDIIRRAMPGYNSIRKREIGKRFRTTRWKPYVKWAMDEHLKLVNTLYYPFPNVLATRDRRGLNWVTKEIVRLQNIAYARAEL